MHKLPTIHKIIETTTPEGSVELVYADRPKNLNEMLYKTVSRYGDLEGFIDQDTRLSFNQFASAVNKVAATLYHVYGIRKGDRVAIMLRNGLEFATSFFAIARLGAITVTLNTGLKGEDVAYQVNDSGSVLLIIEPDFADFINEVKLVAGGLKHIFSTGIEPLEGTIAFSELLKDEGYTSVEAEVDEMDSGVIMYTSGTTGKPKGALLSYRGLIASAMNAVSLCDLQVGRDKMMAMVPLFHTTGLSMVFCAAVYSGIPLVLIKKFKSADSLKIIEDEKITIIIGVPTIFWLMLNEPEFGRYDLSSLRYLAAGGSSSPEDLLKTCAEKLPGVQLVPGYGLTEANAMTHSTATFDEALSKNGSVGLVAPLLDAMIVDNSGNELPAGEPGELLLKGCQVMKGYWNNPVATRETVIDGWLHTGDIAAIDEDGYTYIFDRMKDMIIRGGENIYSIEIENVLYRNPKVLEAAVLGVPDPVFGEQVKAVIVLRPGEQATNEEFQEFCRKSLANFKVPKFVEFREALPRNPAGKVIKGELK
ncbi:class I adenylate-forming enzyme family protein [Chloroflexota bacterium]